MGIPYKLWTSCTEMQELDGSVSGRLTKRHRFMSLVCLKCADWDMTRGRLSPATTYVTILFSYPQHAVKERGTVALSSAFFLFWQTYDRNLQGLQLQCLLPQMMM